RRAGVERDDVRRPGFGLPQLFRQRLEAQRRRRRQGHAALDDVLELADVARKREGQQPLHRLGRDSFDGAVVLLRVLLEERSGEERDVFAALPERRYIDLKDIEPEEQVLAEPPRSNLGLEIAIRRR